MLRSTIHKEKPTRYNNVSKFHYSIFIWCSTCLEQHITHHQEPKTALAAYGFLYVKGCWTCPTTCVCVWHCLESLIPTTATYIHYKNQIIM